MSGEHIVEFTLGDGSEEAVQVDLTYDRVVCNRHGEPFRDEWPKGFPTFGILLFQEISDEDTFLDVVGKDTKLISAAFDRLPICERVSKPVLMGAYLSAGIGKRAKCDNCGAIEDGTSYRTTIDRFEHLCFQCIVYRLAPLQ